MEIKFANNASSRLAAAISAVSTKMTVLPTMGMLFPELLLPTDYFMCTLTDSSGAMEIVKVTAVDGDDFTIVRAQEATLALSFPQNSVCENRLTADSMMKVLNDVKATPTQEGRVRLATREETVENLVADAAVTPAGLIDYQLIPGIIMPFVGQFEGVHPINSITGKADPYWRLCDGAGGTPDLSDRFPMGYSAAHPMSTSGGTTTMENLVKIEVGEAALTVDQIPPHTHTYRQETSHNWITSGSWYSGKNSNFDSTGEMTTSSTGGGAAHKHPTTVTYGAGGTAGYYPPYYAVAWIMRLGR